MRRKSKELDVDYIGGQGPLIKEEEKQISEYLKAQRLLRSKETRQTTKGSSKRKKVIV